MVSAEIRERAKSILRNQSVIPLSPAGIDSRGKLCLCGAAALAAAGCEVLIGTEALQSFTDSLEKRVPGSLEQAFGSLGWDNGLCNYMREVNDSTHPDDRASALSRALDLLPFED